MRGREYVCVCSSEEVGMTKSDGKKEGGCSGRRTMNDVGGANGLTTG